MSQRVSSAGSILAAALGASTLSAVAVVTGCNDVDKGRTIEASQVQRDAWQPHKGHEGCDGRRAAG